MTLRGHLKVTTTLSSTDRRIAHAAHLPRRLTARPAGRRSRQAPKPRGPW